MHTVTIEILRQGSPYGHNLSKKTKYIALCGSHPPADLTVKCDQNTFIRYKQKLRYVNSSEKSRLEGIHFFEQLITKILDDITPLQTEGQTNDWLHLRLVVTPKELAQLPFELALTPKGFQGYLSKPFLLNPQRLTTLTREVRQVAPTRYLWPHKPHILFAWADPAGTVPHEDHFNLLIDILKHYARPIKNNAEPVPDLAPLITQLKKASLKSINDVVKTGIADGNPYTYIHILAHGGKEDSNGGDEFKLVLHDNIDSNNAHYANGNEIANAILEIDGEKILIPAILTLMACDSSNEGGISLPSGSLAHQLHESGVPCIFASQFPLTKEGSTKLVSTLYEKLLIEAEDPRKALYETRKVLAFNSDEAHDWASLVAYVRFPEDIAEQLKDNRLKVLLQSMETANSWADHLLKHRNEIKTEKVAEVFEMIKIRLDMAIKGLEDLFEAYNTFENKRFTEHFGLLGSAWKRKAEHLFRMADLKKDQADSLLKESKDALSSSREWYFQGYDKQKKHWTAIQYLSLTAIIEGSLEGSREKDILTIARILAEDDLRDSQDPMQIIWAWGTLAELNLLFPFTLTGNKTSLNKEILSSKGKASQFISNIAKAKYTFASNPSVNQDDILFAQESTYRQFERYINWWPSMMSSSSVNQLKDMAKELMKNFKH
jgi:hypothetical protein